MRLASLWKPRVLRALSALRLRGFGLCPATVSQQETKAAVASLKAAYRERAKVWGRVYSRRCLALVLYVVCLCVSM